MAELSSLRFNGQLTKCTPTPEHLGGTNVQIAVTFPSKISFFFKKGGEVWKANEC